MKHLFELIFENEEDIHGGKARNGFQFFENLPFMVEAIAAKILYPEESH